MQTVFVITATIQHMNENEKYFEVVVVGVASTQKAADFIEAEARERREVLYTDCETHEVQD